MCNRCPGRHKNVSISLGFVLYCAAGAALFASRPASAAVVYWDGVNNASWLLASDWSSSSNATTPVAANFPGYADTAVFNISTVNSSDSVYLNGNQSVAGLVFSSTGSTTFVNNSGNDTLYLGGSGVTMNAGAGAATIENSYTSVVSSGTWSFAPLTSLTVASIISATSPVTITKTGLGQLNLTNNGNYTYNSGASNLAFDVEQGRLLIGLGNAIPGNMSLYVNGGSYFNSDVQWSNGNTDSTYAISVGTAGAQWEVQQGNGPAEFAENGTAAYTFQAGAAGSPVNFVKSGFGSMSFSQNSSSNTGKTYYSGNTYFNLLGIGGLYSLPQDSTSPSRTTRLYNTTLIGGSVGAYDATQMANGTASTIRIINSAASQASFFAAQDPMANQSANLAFFSSTNLQRMITPDSNGVVVLPAGIADSDTWNMANIGNGNMFLSAQSSGPNTNTFQGSLLPGAGNTYRLGGTMNASTANETSTGLSVQTATLAAGNNLIVGSGLAGSIGTVWLRQNSSAFNGSVSINGDTVSANDSSYAVPGYNMMVLSLAYSGALPNAASYSIGPGSNLYLDNTSVNVANRLSDTAPISMGDDSKLILTSSSAVASTETVGAVTANGCAALRVEHNGSFGPKLTVSNATTTGGGTVVFESLTTLSGTGGTILLNNLNGTPITANVPFMGGAFVAGENIDVNGNNRQNYTWAKYDFTGATGVRAFTSSDFTSGGNLQGNWDLSGSDNIDLTAPLTLTSNANISSLRLDGGGQTFSVGSNLLTVGAIMNSGTSAGSTGAINGSSGTITSSNGNLYVYNNGKLTISPKLTGNFNLILTENEPGQPNDLLTVSNASNNFVGNVYFNNMFVAYTSDGVWGPVTNRLLLNGAVLDNNGSNLTVTHPITILAGGALLSYNGNTNFAGQLSGSGNFSIFAGETAVFSNSSSSPNNFTGVLTVQGPLNNSGNTATTNLLAGAVNVFGNNAAIDLQSMSVLDLTNNGANPGYSQTLGSLEDSGQVTLGAATLTVGGNNIETVYMGGIYGTGNVVKTGTAIWVIGGIQQYTGATTVSSGTLQLYTQGGAYNSAHNAGNIALSSSINIASGAVLDVSAYTGMSTEFTVGAAGTNNQLLSGSGTVLGDMVVGSLGSVNPSGLNVIGNLTLSGGVLLNSNGTSSIYANEYIMQSGTAASNLVTSSAALIMNGTGLALLSGTNTYGGTTSIYSGTLEAASTAALPKFNVTGSVSVANGATLAIAVAGSGWMASDIGNLMAANSGSFAAGSSLGIDNSAGNFTYASALSGSMGLTVFGGNSLTLSSTASNFSGNLSVMAGTLSFANIGDDSSGTNSIPSSLGQPLVGNGTITLGGSTTTATLQFVGSASSSSNRTISLANNATVDASGSGGAILTLTGGTAMNMGSGSANLSLIGSGQGIVQGGIVGSAGALVKNGAGTWYLGGPTTFTQSVSGTNAMINNGTLVLGNTMSLANGTAVLLLNGGTLATSAGTAAYVGGMIVAGSGAHLISPGGNGPIGTLTVGGGLSLASNSSLQFDIGSTSNLDQIIDQGALNFNGAGSSNVFVTGGLSAGTYKLIGYNSDTDVLASNFNLVAISGGTTGYALSLSNTAGGPGELDLIVSSGTVAGPAAWNISGSGSWNVAGNWSTGAIPNGQAQQAVLGTLPTSRAVLSLDGTQTVGLLTFNNTAGYTLTPGSGGLLVFDNTGGTGLAEMLLLAGTHSITAPVMIANGNLLISESGGSSLALSGNVNDDGNQRSLTITGDGTGMVTLSGSNGYTGGTYVNSGTLVLDGASSLAAGSSLFIGSGTSSTALVVPSAVAATAQTPSPTLAPVPEPGTFVLLAVAAAGACYTLRRMKKAK